MQQALEALDWAADCIEPRKPINCDCPVCFASNALRERLAQPEQEPKCGAIIEVFGKDWRLDYMSLPVGKHKLYTQQYTYTAPSQRKPLTDEEIWLEYQRLWPFHPAEEPTLAKDISKFARAIEAKLKEKNNG